MNRRTAGLLIGLITIVGVAAATAPGQLLAGRPVAVPLPDPPVVGDCLIDPTDEPAVLPADRDGQVLRFGPCLGDRTLGEVVAVQRGTTREIAEAVRDADCRADVLSHAGLVRRHGTFGLAGDRADDPVSWAYSVDASTTWIPQIPWSPAASSWVACVARPNRADWPTLQATLANSYDGGKLPGDYGTCWKSTDMSFAIEIVDCDLPHIAELIAVGQVSEASSVDLRTIEQSCTDQAARVMRRADYTVDGQLTIHVHADTTSRDNGQPGDVTCYVTSAGGRSTIGSVVGLGSAQLTFAG